MQPVQAYRPDPRVVLPFMLSGPREAQPDAVFRSGVGARTFQQRAAYRFATLKSVVRAFNKRATGAMSPEGPATGSPATADRKNDNPSSVP